MELVFRKNILERVLDAVTEASAAGKVVDHIVLNDAEQIELQRVPLGRTLGDPLGQLSTKSDPGKDEPVRISGLVVKDERGRPVF